MFSRSTFTIMHPLLHLFPWFRNPHPGSSSPQNVPLLLILVIPCSLQILTTIGITGLLLLHHRHRQVEAIANNVPIGILFCLLSLTVTLATAVYLSHKLAQPILRLSKASQRVARGEFCQLVDVGPVKELATLARSFNQMSQEIQQAKQTLESYSQSLEQKISERTQALEQEIYRRTAIEAVLYRANQELEQIAFLDGLTQVGNRRHFDDCLNREWWRHQRMQAPISIILCDIDFFKQYNDTYGHQAGDECLRQVAAVLQSAFQSATKQPTEVVARYGGEEFAVILPETSAARAVQIANTIQREIQQLQLAHRGSPIHSSVTLSFGVATLVPELESTATQLIARADRSLYRAKSKGRNCIESEWLELENCNLQLV